MTSPCHSRTRSRHWAFQVAAACALGSALAAAADPPAKKPAVFEIVLPPEAQLEVDGARTDSTGEKRRFESPPVEIGSTYAYTIRASWRGKTVTREIRIRPGRLTVIDLRDNFRAPIGSFALVVPSSLQVRPGAKTFLPLELRRDNYSGPVVVQFRGLPEGVQVDGLMIREGQDRANAEFAVAVGATNAVAKVTVIAQGGPVQRTAVLHLKIARPKEEGPVLKVPSKSEANTVTVPKTTPESVAKPKATLPEPVLAVSLPEPVAIEPGQVKYVEVRINARAKFASTPTIRLDAPAGQRLTCKLWTVSDFTKNPAAYWQGYALQAAADAPAGKHDIRVTVTANGKKWERAFPVTVKPPPKTEPKPAPIAEPRFFVSLPDEVMIEPGQVKYVEVRINTKGKLASVPTIGLEIPARST